MKKVKIVLEKIIQIIDEEKYHFYIDAENKWLKSKIKKIQKLVNEGLKHAI